MTVGPVTSGPGVAVLKIRGAMSQREEFWSCGEGANYEEITERFTGACSDPGVSAIVLDGDTPGGDVPGLEQAIARMRAARDASGKPVIGFCNELLASGGVWLCATVCHAIYLPPSGRMGSVGVVIAHETDARWAAEQGFDRTIVRDPPGKANPNGDEPLDELGRSRLQTLVSAASSRFIAAIAQARSLDEAAIRAWNGGMFTGAEAVSAGLADGIGSLEETIALASNLALATEAA